MTELDPFEALRRRNPVPDPSALPGADDDAAARALLARITAQPPRRRRRWHPRRAVLVPIAAGVVILLAAAAWVVARTADDPTMVTCYPSVALDGPRLVTGDDGLDPVAACTAVWGTSRLPGTAGPPPTLEACIVPGTHVGVFPADGEDPCRTLGLQPYLPPDHPDDPLVAAMVERLRARVSEECLDLPTAEALARDELDAAGFGHWSIETPMPATDERPCASLAIDAEAETLLIVPLDRHAIPAGDTKPPDDTQPDQAQE